MKATTAPIVKPLEDMNETELAFQRERVWSICKSSSGFWARVDEAPFRFFPEHSSEDALRDAEEYLAQHGIKVNKYIFY